MCGEKKFAKTTQRDSWMNSAFRKTNSD